MNEAQKRNLEALDKFLTEALESTTSLKEALLQAKDRLQNLKETL